MNDEAGYTMVEVVIAIALVGLVLAGLLASTSAGVAGVDGARRSTTALFLAEQRMEQAKAFAMSKDPGQGWGNLSAAAFPAEGYGAIAGYADYRRSMIVTNDPGGAPSTKQVEVWVFYRPATDAGMAPETAAVLSTILVSR